MIVGNDPEILEECLAEGYLVLLGEASEDAVPEEAGIARAGWLIAAVDSDADNVFVVLSARKLNPGPHIAARASSDESAAKLKIAGADRTLSPYAVGGRRLARHAATRRAFVDVVTRGEKGIEFRLEEFSVPEASNITEHTIGELKGEDGRHSTRYPHSRGQIRHDAGDRLRAGDTLIVLGSRGQIERLERLMRGEEIVEK